MRADTARMSVMMSAAGIETMSPLERLGLHVLLDSAHIKKCEHEWVLTVNTVMNFVRSVLWIRTKVDFYSILG